MAVGTLGIGTPVNPVQLIPWGISPYGVQGPGFTPYFSFGQPLAAQPVQQVVQALQIVPQQLQQIQQLLQLIPGQLAQLQQLTQLLPQQIQQLLASQFPGTGFGLTSPWGITPQVFAQPAHVM